MSKEVLFHSSTPEELKESILSGVKEMLDNITKPEPATKYLTRAEVCEMLKIDLATLWSWTKKGKLQSYGIGSRVYYKLNEVEDSIQLLRK